MNHGDYIMRSMDPRIDLDKPVHYVIEEGAQQITWDQNSTENAGGNSSSFTFSNANPPGPGVVIDKKMLIACGFTITFQGIPAAGQPLIGYEALGPIDPSIGTSNIRALGTDAPRFLPIAQIMNSCNVTINNASVTQAVFNYIDPLMRYNCDQRYDETQLSLAPDEQDQYQQYSDFVNFGSSRNVLGDYGEQGFYTNRGGFSGVTLLSNPIGDGVTPVTAVFEVDSVEPIFVSPMGFGDSNQRGFIGVQTFRVQINTIGDLSRIWSHDSVLGQPILATAVVMRSNRYPKPLLYSSYLTPKILEQIPALNTYPYYYVDPQETTVGLIAAGQTKTLQRSNNFQLQTIPKYLYVYIREQNSDRTFASTDTYCRIESLSINFANKNNLLNGASREQLYQMSVKNGCKMSYTQWSKHVGSVICVDFGQDINLNDDQAVGVQSGSLQISAQVIATNLSNTDKFYTMYLTPVYPGVFDISGNQAIALSGFITPSDLISVKNYPKLDYVDAHNFTGGDFGGSVKDIGRQIWKKLPGVAKGVAKALPEIAKYVAPLVAPRFAPYVEEGADLINRLVNGSGLTRSQAKKVLKNGQAHLYLGNGLMEGGGGVGGTLLPGKSVLAKRLMAANRR